MSSQNVAEESIFSSFNLTTFNQCMMCLNLYRFPKIVSDLHSGSYNDIFLYSKKLLVWLSKGNKYYKTNYINTTVKILLGQKRGAWHV